MNHTEKRINVFLNKKQIPDDFEEQIVFVKDTTNKYTVSCTYISVLKELLKKGYNAYLDFPVSDWETFELLVDLGVSDIIIDGTLCFSMSDINSRKIGLNIRTCPIGYYNSLRKEDKSYPNSWFMRPEDIDLYEKYIDYLEFPQEKEKILFKIYKKKSFPFSIKELFPQVKSDIENGLITSSFAENRLNCHNSCLIPTGTKCNLCKNQLGLIKIFKQFKNLT